MARGFVSKILSTQTFFLAVKDLGRAEISILSKLIGN
jgi:hypothetical protein